MTESGVRTTFDLVVGFLLTALVSWAATQGFNIKVDPQMTEVIFGVLWSLFTIAVAVVKRKLVPTSTDAPGAARTDVTTGGKVV
jgi:ABC-type antimicrobial peptide transport system permease subunit